MRLSILVGERYTYARRTEIVIGPVNDVPGKIAHDADARRDTNFHSRASLARNLGMLVLNAIGHVIFVLDYNRSIGRAVNVVNLVMEPIGMFAARDDAEAAKSVRCKTRAPNRPTHGQGAEGAAADIALAIEDETFKAEGPILTKEILHIDASAPGAITIEKTIISKLKVGGVFVRILAAWGIAGVFRNMGIGMLEESTAIVDARITGNGESAPQIEIPFVRAIPFTWCRGLLHDLLICWARLQDCTSGQGQPGGDDELFHRLGGH